MTQITINRRMAEIGRNQAVLWKVSPQRRGLTLRRRVQSNLLVIAVVAFAWVVFGRVWA